MTKHALRGGLVFLALVGPWVALWSCDSESGICSPGANLECFCSDGSSGSRFCVEDGSEWTDCFCDSGGDADADGDSDGDSGPVRCASDLACDDGLFCTGLERCSPGAEGADDFGCLPGPGDPCIGGQVCGEEEDRCLTQCEETSDADGDGHASVDCGGDDCDDSDANRYPGNVVVCDTTLEPPTLDLHDEDCDPTTIGPDADADGYVAEVCCNPEADGEVRCGQDCDDTNGEINPDATEVCNGADENCDGTVDEGVLRTFYPDTDGDGFGDPAGAPATGCVPGEGYVENSTDCDDSERGRNPGLGEVCDHVHDNDCNGATNPHDEDGDRYDDAGCGGNDCNDADPSVHPGAEERCDTLGDNDCDGSSPHDGDGDGFDDLACGGNDCNDGDFVVHPGAAERCNGADDNCNGTPDEGVTRTFYRDGDGDGHGDPSSTTTGCSPSAGYVDLSDDCNDGDRNIYPGAVEYCDRLDNDCSHGGGADTSEDSDEDGFAPRGALCTGGMPATDCNDGNATVNPDQSEWFEDPVPGTDSYDYNCDGAETQRWTTMYTPDCDDLCWDFGIPACGEWGQCHLCGDGSCYIGAMRRQECH